MSSTLYTDSELASSVRSMTYEDLDGKVIFSDQTMNKYAYFLAGDETPFESDTNTKINHRASLVDGATKPMFYVWDSDSGENISYDMENQLKQDEYGINYMTPINGHPVYCHEEYRGDTQTISWHSIDSTNATDTTTYGDIIDDNGSISGKNWLATPVVNLRPQFTGFEFPSLGVGYYSTDAMTESIGSIDNECYGLRPIVTLRTDLHVVSGTGEDADHAWVLERD
jgi:hypothetical protein